jgi:hypothetical protein
MDLTDNKMESVWDYEQRRKKEVQEKYGESVAKYYMDLHDELGTAFYKKGTYKSTDGTLQDFKDYLKAIEIIMEDEGRNTCEAAYDKGRLQMKEDIENIINNWKCDIKSLKVDSIFYTLKEDIMRSGCTHINEHKWKVISIETYEIDYEIRRVIKVQELDRNNITVSKNNFWIFIDKELIDIAYDNEEQVKKVNEEHDKKETSWAFQHKDMLKGWNITGEEI